MYIYKVRNKYFGKEYEALSSYEENKGYSFEKVKLTVEENFGKNSKDLKELFCKIKESEPSRYQILAEEDVKSLLRQKRIKDKEDAERQRNNEFVKVDEKYFQAWHKKFKKFREDENFQALSNGEVELYTLNENVYAQKDKDTYLIKRRYF